jgi:type IV secretion system protein VirB10
MAIIIAGGLLGAGGFAYLSYSRHVKASQEAPKEIQAEVPTKTFKLPPPADRVPAPRPELPVASPMVATSMPLAPITAGTPRALAEVSRSAGPALPPPAVGALDKNASSLMSGLTSDSHATATAPTAPGAAQRAQDTGPLGSMLNSSSVQLRVASTLKNRDFILAKGAYLDCALQTKIDSTVPGMTACVVTRDVYSDTGRFVVIERGSQLTGEYQSNMREGQSRIFVLWNRVKTPSGVVIDLDSPGVDPLGASGVEGYVDNHFLERFGGALLLSLVQDLGSAASNAVNNASTVQLNNTAGATQNMAAEALKHSIGMQPSLVKNQGDRVGIMVARDLDFGSVYGYADAEQ